MAVKKKEVVQRVIVHDIVTPYGSFKCMVFKDQKTYDVWFEASSRLISGKSEATAYGCVTRIGGAVMLAIPRQANADTIMHEVIHVAQIFEVLMYGNSEDEREIMPKFMSTVVGMVTEMVKEGDKLWGGGK